jgi:hypothetical protein
MPNLFVKYGNEVWYNCLYQERAKAIMTDIIRLFSRLMKVATVLVLLVAVSQEMEKPPERRFWHGRVLGMVPYDFRLPTIERLLNRYWNPGDSRVWMPTIFGVGWAINLPSLMGRVSIYRQDYSERHYLMPTASIEETLASYVDAE